MRALFISVLLFGSSACTTPKTIAPPHDGYARAERAPAGCFEHTQPREYNVILGAGLEGRLQSLIADRTLGDPRCWYEGGKDTLLLTAGGECGPHDRVTFGHVGVDWTLLQIKNVAVVICDEKAQ